MKTIIRNNEYMSYVRNFPCLVCKSEDGVHAHHVRWKNGGGIGLRPNDTRVVNLCHFHHAELHHYGEASFWEKIKIEPDDVIIRLLTMYASLNFDKKDLINTIEQFIELRRRT